MQLSFGFVFVGEVVVAVGDVVVAEFVDLAEFGEEFLRAGEGEGLFDGDEDAGGAVVVLVARQFIDREAAHEFIACRVCPSVRTEAVETARVRGLH
ncbi:MAG: hypothetical protein MPJ22_01770 [Pirellulales bacterium]|nr:hypothetical protein [Pirellulales bacterium]